MKKIMPLFGDSVLVFIQGTEMNHRMGRVTEDNPHGTLEQQVILREIFNFAKKAGARKIYGPDTVRANAEIMTHDDPRFSQIITLPSEEKAYAGMELLRGPEANADGLVVPLHVGLWEILADCLMVIIRDPATKKLVATHAGRESLLDWQKILKTGARRFQSSIDAAMAHFNKIDPTTLQCAAIFGIGFKNFKHPIWHDKFGVANAQMLEYIWARWPSALPGENWKEGELDLKELAIAQLEAHGILEKNIFTDDGIDTFTDTEPDGKGGMKYSYFSQRRGENQRNGLLLVPVG